MIIPSDPVRREMWIAELIDKCMVSVEDRKGDYSNLRSYYLFGSSADSEPAIYNKIFPTIDQLTSFLYAGDTARFTVHLGATAPKVEYDKVAVINDVLNDKWFDTGGDKQFLAALTWALVFGCTHVKAIWNHRSNEVMPYCCLPGSMGVLREDIAATDRQEAICQSFYITKTELYSQLYEHPNRLDIISKLTDQQHQEEYIPTSVDRLMLSQVEPNMIGSINLGPVVNRLKPQVDEDTIEMHELWVFDDEKRDYRCFTMGEPHVLIWDRTAGGNPEGKTKAEREGIYIKGMQPFIQIVPNPEVSYYWGQSEVSRLVLLQELRNKRMSQIERLLELQVSPPALITGMTGLPDEKKFALDLPGSWLSNDMPNAKVDRLAPTMPEDLFKEVQEIDAMFAEASGINAIMQGQGEPGVRSAGHASQLARLGSSRAKKRALAIEDSLSLFATHYLKLLIQHDETHYDDDRDLPFILKQFTNDFTVKVDAHSNSPIFQEDNRQLAFELFKAGAIDKESLLDLLDPPMKQLLKRRLEKIAPQQHGGAPDGPKLVSGGRSK